MYSDLLSNIRQFASYSEEEVQKLLSLLQTDVLQKGDHFLAEGQISQQIAFISSGLVMHYNIYEMAPLRDLLLRRAANGRKPDRWLQYFFIGFGSLRELAAFQKTG